MIKRIIHDRILSVPHSLKALHPADREEIRPEKTLFGWVLRLGRHQIECASEEEARFLEAFAGMGYTEAPVPRDPEVLRNVLPDLERSVNRIWEQVLEETSVELNPSRRRELIELVWERLRQRIWETSQPVG